MDSRTARILGASLTTLLIVVTSGVRGTPVGYVHTAILFALFLLVFRQELDDL